MILKFAKAMVFFVSAAFSASASASTETLAAPEFQSRVSSGLKDDLNIRPSHFLTGPSRSCNFPAGKLALRPIDIRVQADWVPSFEIKRRIVIGAGIANDGKMYDVQVLQSSGNAQLDFDCLQAVMGASGSCPSTAEEGSLDRHTFVFDQDTKCDHVSGIANFLHKQPEPHSRGLAFYRIPLDVMNRYPGLFTETELLAEENIGIFSSSDTDPKLPDWAIGKLRHIYQTQWCSFFRKYPKGIKKQIEKFRDELLLDERRPG